jgi:hypothetical protein
MLKFWSRLIVFFVFTVAAMLHGQTFRGALSGTVVDPQGAVVAHATVVLSNPRTNDTISITSNDAGNFNFPELPVGSYKLSVSQSGFATKNIDNIMIELSKATSLKIELSLGQESTVVSVEASGIQTDTVSSSLVAVVNAKSVQEIPLNGRNFTQMVTLSAGVNINKSVNGARTNGINYQIDGADNNDPWSNNVASNQGGVAGIAGGLVPIEAIDQFSMQASGESDMGRNGGANSNMVLKSGTNQLHGDVFYFDRNEFFAWRSAVQAPHTRVPEIRNHQGGFTLGGPLWKDHTFFFLAGEIQIANANNSVGDTVLSDAWISSARSLLQLHSLAPNAVSTNLYNELFPADSKAGAATTSNYLSNGRNTYNSYNGVIKVDHRFSDRHQISLRYLGTTGTQSADVGSHYADYFQTAPMHIHNFSIVENSTFSDKLVNQITLGTGYFLQTFNDRNQNFDTQGTGLNLGLTGLLAAGATKIQVSGFDYTGATPPLGRTDVTGHVTDTLHWTLGHHSLKLGGEYRHANLNVGYYTNGRGSFTFDGSRGPWTTADCNSLGFTASSSCSALKSVADFLNGQPSNGSQATILRNNPQRVYLVNTVDGYVQDSWQILPQLTLNYGVRWSYPGVVKDDRNSLYNFDPSFAGGFRPIPLYDRNLMNFAPRVGFSFQPFTGTSNTVIRGAYGWFYDQPTVGQFVYNSIGNTGATGIYSNPAGSSPVFAPSVTNITFTPGQAIFPATLSASTLVGAFSIQKDYRAGYLQNFNLNIEQQLAKNTLLTIAYVGSVGRHLALVRDINQPRGPVAAGAPSNSTRPYFSAYPNLLAINQVQSGGTSNFNSFQLSLRQAPWHGVSATAYYTWGRAMDFTSTYTTPMNSYNLASDYGPSTFDVRNTFTGFANWDLPQFSHHLPRITKGYSVKALYLFSGGNPINILAGTDISKTSEGKDRANQVVGVPVFAGRTATTGATTQTYQYLTKTAFVSPSATCACYGNVSRDSVYGPGFGDVDLSFFKVTPITERVNVELRAEIYNIANQANFANPSGTVTSSSFGTLTQTRNGSSAPGLGQGEPRNMQFALKFSF